MGDLANNPVVFAVVEGVTLLGWEGSEIDVLSLGCTEDTIDFKQKGHGGMFWVRRAIEAALRGQSRSALGMARHLTGRDRGLESVVRISPPVAPAFFPRWFEGYPRPSRVRLQPGSSRASRNKGSVFWRRSGTFHLVEVAAKSRTSRMYQCIRASWLGPYASRSHVIDAN